MSDKPTEPTIYAGNPAPGNGCPSSGSDRGIADPMATTGLQLGYGGEQSLAAEISEEEKIMEVGHLASMVFNASSEAPTLHNKKVYAYPNQRMTNVLDIWKKIEDMEKVEKELLGKIQKRLAGMNNVVSRANNIHKSVKNDLGVAFTYSFSDLQYVCFVFKSRKRDAPREKPTRWAVKKFDRDAFAECISGTSELDKTRTMDELMRNYTTEISRRRQHKNQRPAFW